MSLFIELTKYFILLFLNRFPGKQIRQIFFSKNYYEFCSLSSHKKKNEPRGKSFKSNSFVHLVKGEYNKSPNSIS